MTTDNSTQSTQIKVVDLFLSIEDRIYADVSIEKPYIYYCMGTEDTREDGRVRVNDDVISKIHNIIINSTETDSYDGAVTLKLSTTLTDGTVSHISIGANVIASKIIDVLSHVQMEFIFLEQFIWYL